MSSATWVISCFRPTVAAVAAATALCLPIAAQANTFFFDVTGIFSNDAVGDPLNETFTINIGPESRVVGIGWDVTLFADAPSLLSEMTVGFGSSSTQIAFLNPGAGNLFAGTASYASAGISDLGILPFKVNADGILKLEFFETFDDFTDDFDGQWKGGVLTIQTTPIPEPGTYALMLLGVGLVGAWARRRRA